MLFNLVAIQSWREMMSYFEVVIGKIITKTPNGFRAWCPTEERETDDSCNCRDRGECT